MPSSENINEQSSKVIIGSQDLHHNVPSVSQEIIYFGTKKNYL